MKEQTYYKHIGLALATALVITACGGGGSTGNATQDTAIAKMTAFAKDGTPIPTLQDYLDAGVVGVTADNLADINEIVSNLSEEEVDTKEEIQALVGNAGVSLAPVAVATASKTFATEGQRIRFSAEGSSDADGNIVKYVWKEGNTVLSEIPVFDKADFSVGKHTLALSVTDNDGNTNSTTVKVKIQAKAVPAPTKPAVNKAPIANAGPDRIMRNGQRITLGGSATDDGLPNNSLTYTWKLGKAFRSLREPQGYVPNKVYSIRKDPLYFEDENIQNAVLVSAYTNETGFPRTVRATLTVSDGNLSSTDTVTIKVNAGRI